MKFNCLTQSIEVAFFSICIIVYTWRKREERERVKRRKGRYLRVRANVHTKGLVLRFKVPALIYTIIVASLHVEVCLIYGKY